MDYNREPVTAIEGIGPAFAAALGTVGIHTVFDLLRWSPAEIHESVATRASLDQVLGWTGAAGLLQLEGMNPQWAEALVSGGINGVEALYAATRDEVETVLDAAAAAGTIPGAPSASERAVFLRDAGVLRFTALTDGTVVDEDRNPLVNVTLHLGGSTAETNDQGRFRLLRLPAWERPPLRIEHPGFDLLLVEEPVLVAGPQMIMHEVYRLRALAPEEQPTVFELSEIEGDELPEPSGHVIRAKAKLLSEVAEGEILEVHEFYASAADAKLVSRFRVYRNGDFVVPYVRVPRARLEDDPEIGDRFEFRNDSFHKVDLSTVEIRRRILARICKKAFAGRPRPQTPQEFQADFEARYEFLAQRGFYRSPRRRI